MAVLPSCSPHRPVPSPQLHEVHATMCAMRAMLAIDGSRAKPGPGWWAQQKANGSRKIVVIADGRIRTLNRHGEPTAMPPHVLTDLSILADAGFTITLDGELVSKAGEQHRAVLYVFDLVDLATNHGVAVTPATPLSRRIDALETLMRTWQPDNGSVRLIPTARTPEQVAKMRAEQRPAGGEGIVHKDPRSAWIPARHNTDRSRSWVKEKWTKDVDCIVTRFGVDGRDNYEVAMVDPDQVTRLGLADATLPGNGRLADTILSGNVPLVDALRCQYEVLVAVGEVSRLTGDGPTLVVGDVVIVNTLYAKGDRLEQPVKGRRRDDKPWTSCTIDQLDTIRPNPKVYATI